MHGAVGWVRTHIGFLVLVGLLSWITLTTLQPGLFLIGWDNYSSYFGGYDGLFRTFFSTWRAYRGIGVPGDSESTDLVRQALLIVMSPFVPEALRDQLYVMGCLWLGAIGVYALAVRYMRRYTHASSGIIDASAAIAGATYVLNLNAVSTFYFPIITYITRYASLPLLLLSFDHCIHERQFRLGSVVLCIGAVMFSAGSFITATVFFTTAILLGMYVLFQGMWKRGFLMLCLFVCLNAFWLVPFANYTGQKSESLRLAPVFIDTNEAQLNQSPQSYSLWKQLILYPNFFNTRYNTVDTGRSTPLHPMTSYVDSQDGQWVLGVLPLCALLGMVMLLFRPKKYYRLYWIPAIYVLFIILSSQEQSPLGFIPALLNRIPYFQVVFRFGDTKFHPYISFAASLAVGMLIVLTAQYVRRFRRADWFIVCAFALALVIVPLRTAYAPYMHGDFLPKYLFVELPNAYRDVAAIINKDPASGRVLHLPYDQNLYWRSHTWGYMGSAFFQYLLKRPYMDKTFEPASLETTDEFLALTGIIRDANQTVGEGLHARANALYAHLIHTNASWVIFDDSVSPEMRIRNMRYWGAFNTTDSLVLLTALEADGKLMRVADIPIDLSAIAKVYTARLNQSPIAPLGEPHLVLYRVIGANERLSFKDSAAVIEEGLTRGRENAKISTLSIQTSRYTDALIYPLLHKDSIITPGEDGMTLQHQKRTAEGMTQGSVNVASGSGAVVQVRVQKDANNMLLRFYRVEAPSVHTTSFLTFFQEVRVPLSRVPGITQSIGNSDDYIANWHVLGDVSYSNVRIMIDGVTFPVPPLTDSLEHVVGSTLSTSDRPVVKILQGQRTVPVDSGSFSLTDMPNCFGDQMNGYAQALDRSKEHQVTLQSTNGSTCVVYPLSQGKSAHAEVRLNYQAAQIDGSIDKPTDEGQVSRYVSKLPKPNLLSLCITGQTDGVCLNTHEVTALDSKGSMVIPTEVLAESFSHVRLALIPVGTQTQTLTITGGETTYFDTVQTFPLSIPNAAYTGSVVLGDTPLTVTLPYILSRGSYYSGPRDGWFVSNRPCETAGGYRTTRKMPAGGMSYITDCYNEISLRLPFDSGVSRLWAVSYMLFSGKYPQFMLGDPFSHYTNQYLSLYQGYPSVPGMLSLQAPQQWYRPYGGNAVEEIVNGHLPVWTYVWVHAAPELSDTRTKSYIVHQDSKNTGMFGLFDTNVVEFPASWQDMVIRTGSPDKAYVQPTTFTYKDILPSLTEVSLEYGSGEGALLLLNRVGYDPQWVAYPDMWSVIFGTNGIQPDRCDSSFSCYELPVGQERWYLFYTPERLAIIGWIIFILTVGIWAYSLRNASRRSSV